MTESTEKQPIINISTEDETTADSVTLPEERLTPDTEPIPAPITFVNAIFFS